MLWEKIDKKDYTLYKNNVIDLKVRVYEMQDVNKVYINYKGCNLLVPMLIWEFETDLRFACLDDVQVEGIEEGERNAYFTVNKEHTDSLLEEVYFFLTDYNMDCVLDDFYRVNWEEDDSKIRIGTHVIYKGKDYQGGVDEGTVYIATYNEEDVDDSFQYIKFSGRYVKDLDIEKDVSAFYEIIEMCDYMGETFLPMGSTEDIIGLFASDSKYLEKGFVPDGRDGYIKEVKRSEVTTRLVKEDRLLYYKIWKLLKDRIKDDPSISKFSVGAFIIGFFDERKGCFFWDGNYYVYRIVGGLDIIGPFDEKDIIYACAKILGKESLFDEFKFSEIAEKNYINNVFHSMEEMKKYAYGLVKSEFGGYEIKAVSNDTEIVGDEIEPASNDIDAVRNDSEYHGLSADTEKRAVDTLREMKNRYDAGAFDEGYSLEDVLEFKMSQNAKRREYNGIEHSEYLPVADEYLSEKQIIKYMKSMFFDKASIQNCGTLQGIANVLYQERPAVELVVFQDRKRGADNIVTNNGNLGKNEFGLIKGGVFSIPKYLLKLYALRFSDICSFEGDRFVINDFERFGTEVLNRRAFRSDYGVYMIETLVPFNGENISIPSVNNIGADMVDFVPGGYSKARHEIEIVQKPLQGLDIKAGSGICGDVSYKIVELYNV